jgi:FkbM family methyltransferase
LTDLHAAVDLLERAAVASDRAAEPCPAVANRSADRWPQPAPLNRDRDFVTWPHFNPGQWIDMNPSFVRLGAHDAWAVFTRYAVPPQPGAGSIWVVRVDATMRPLGMPVPVIGNGTDPRVIRVGKRVLIFYAIIEHDGEGVINGSFVALAEFVVAGDKWIEAGSFQLPKRPIEMDAPEGAQHNWEKNWVPFALDRSAADKAPEANFRVGLIYSHDPWTVITLAVEPDKPRRFETMHRSPGMQWDYGTIRGGTPPVPYDDTHLVTFFHAAQLSGSRNIYSVGACVFLARPPYTPVLMTTEPLLMAPYRSGALRFGWRFAGSVVFPLGVERIAEGYRLLSGLDDGEIAAFLVRRDELAARLAPPRAGPTGTVHDYRGGRGARLPLKSLLYVPDPIPGIAELPMVNFIRTIAGRGRSFVDVGAHIGCYTMGLAPGFARVIAFEPSRGPYDWLRRNVALNAYDHVQCEPVALGEQAGTATLHVLSRAGDLNTLSPEVASGRTILDQYTVPVEALDDRGLTDVDLLKIGVEGFEVPVLRGAARTIAASRPVILVKVLGDASRRLDVQAVMIEMGYSLEFLFPLSPELAVCLPHERRHEYQWFI